ncbi:MAG: DUF4389 domain-containing protein, partial [Trebonia sp.]
FFVGFLGWWGALFTGRLPEFAVTYLSGVVRWSTRVAAYEYLLTDVYPPFTFDDDPAYPVRVAIPEPQRLNRAAVFFRVILVFPVSILIIVAALGAGTLVLFIAWLITLVAGQLPPSLYLAYTALTRFQTRYAGYLWMLTPTYPVGLYGDKPGAMAWADQVSPVQAPGFGAPGAAFENPDVGGPQGYSSPQGFGGAAPGDGNPQTYDPAQEYGTPTPGYGPPQGYGAPAPSYGPPMGYPAPTPGYGAPAGYGALPAFQPLTWLLSLTSTAKRWLTTFIVIGALVFGGYAAIYAMVIGSAVGTLNNASATATALEQLTNANITLGNNLNAWEEATKSCNQTLACVTREDSKGASAYGTFATQVSAVQVPASSAADKAKLVSAATAAQRDFTQLGKSTSVDKYNATIASDGLQQTMNAVDQDG